MSADYWLEYAPDDPVRCEHFDHSVNVTYNLGPMLRAAGFPDWDALRGAPASEAAGMLDKVARELRAHPDRYEHLLPENGWGTMAWAVQFCELLRDACVEHPTATIEASL